MIASGPQRIACLFYTCKASISVKGRDNKQKALPVSEKGFCY